MEQIIKVNEVNPLLSDESIDYHHITAQICYFALQVLHVLDLFLAVIINMLSEGFFPTQFWSVG